MLTRHTARQQSRSRLSTQIVQAFNELELPFLAPAVSQRIRRPIRRSITSSRNASPSRKVPSRPTPLRHHTAPLETQRSLATAVDSHNFGEHTDYVPFDASTQQQQGYGKDDETQHLPEKTYELWQRPASDLFHLSPFLNENDHIAFQSLPKLAAPTELKERLNHYYACLQVGRLDRAQRLLDDLNQIFYPHSPELADAYEKYLEAQVNRLIRSPNKDHLVDLQKFFELDLLPSEIPLTGNMLSSMAKAAFACIGGTKLDRTLRRYLNHAAEAGIEIEQDMLSSSLFSESEIARLTSLVPDRFHNYPTTIGTETLQPLDVYADNAPLSHSPAYADSQAPGLQTVPDLRESEQKGLGLKSLKVSLSNLPELNFDDHTDALAAQESLERDVLQAALDRWRNENEITQQMRAQGTLTGSSLGGHVYQWIQDFTKLLEEQVTKAEAMKEKSDHDQSFANMIQCAPVLRMLSPEKIAAGTVLAFMNSMFILPIGTADKSQQAMILNLPLSRVWGMLGREVLADIQLEQANSAWTRRMRNISAGHRKLMIARMYKEHAQKATKSSADQAQQSSEARDFDERIEKLHMTNTAVMKFGAVLFSWFQEVAKLPVKGPKGSIEMQPVATNGLRFRKGRKFNVVNINEEFTKRLKKEPSESLIAKHLPMLVEPRPWTGITAGAYLQAQSSMFRTKDQTPTQMEYLKVADSRGDLKMLYEGLDVIGKVPWRVNGPLFEVMTEIWNTGEGVANFAPADPREDLPPEPSKDDAPAHARWRDVCKGILNEATGQHSQRCYQNMQLEVARSLLNKDFYCPHSIDFRGRAYPIPPYFNHMGADTSRGLFMFARGKPLGETGLRWLKIHLANMHGFDKASLTEREQYANDHLTEIYDSAENPLHGKRWWLKSEDCWQTLAACLELRNALESPVPTQYVSHLPVQQDGSCNGLQHYAALGGDEIGARQVNLAPGDRPADIYTAVADLVRKYVAEDAAKGKEEAKVMDGYVSRKVVKQPVMTNVYGVTFVGASKQVKKQLLDILPKATVDNDINISGIASYIASLIFRALSEMFNGAHSIQKWLGECGARISAAVSPEQIERLRDERVGTHVYRPADIRRKTTEERNQRAPKEDFQFKSTIIWTTPLGLPVVQPYRESGMKNIMTNTKTIIMRIPRNSDPINKRKQLQAFPPNFIHSLDATHMMLSALKCNEVGLQFSSVHDSFWTHAADVPVMNRVLRDAFIQMHSEDVIGRLREEFVARYQGSMLWTSVYDNTPAGKRLLEFYSSKKVKRACVKRQAVAEQDQINLMFEELKRIELVNSEDVEDQVNGRDMVTAASIVEAEGGEHAEVPVSEEMPVAAQANAEMVKESDVFEAGDFAVEDEFDAGEMLESETIKTDDASEQSASEDPVSEQPASSLSGQGGKKGKKAKKTKKTRPPTKVFFWKQLSFPPAPEKGTFDVKQLKESQYFFS